MRISDWSSDVCSSDLASAAGQRMAAPFRAGWNGAAADGGAGAASGQGAAGEAASGAATAQTQEQPAWAKRLHRRLQLTPAATTPRSEERRVGQECVHIGRSRWSPAN